MTAPSLAEMTAHAGDMRSPRRWRKRWRLPALVIAGIGTATGLGLAWNWSSGGQAGVLFIIAISCVIACLFWLLFGNEGRDRTAPEPMGTSEWEIRIRPHFPPGERREIERARRTEGGEA